MPTIRGKIWNLGDGIDTDLIIPARYLVLPLDRMKYHALKPVEPQFADLVQPGDLIVAGKNFGCGSSREQAPAVLRALGIQAIVAVSFARIFYRNAINLGLPVIICSDIQHQAQSGDIIEMTPSTGRIELLGKQRCVYGSSLPQFVLDIIAAGGLMAQLRAQIQNNAHRFDLKGASQWPDR